MPTILIATNNTTFHPCIQYKVMMDILGNVKYVLKLSDTELHGEQKMLAWAVVDPGRDSGGSTVPIVQMCNSQGSDDGPFFLFVIIKGYLIKKSFQSKQLK